MMSPTPPRSLRWFDTDSAKAVTTLLAIVALIVSGWLFFRLQRYVDCVAEQQAADSRRTAAIARATDAERSADAALVAGQQPGGPSPAELRQLDIIARTNTDKVRAANPPPSLREC
jgi:hypothetical protein